MKTGEEKRKTILDAALRCFADNGYSSTSVQHIVDTAKITKPMLYYYFTNKAGLFQALIDWMHEERYRVICNGIHKGRDFKSQLVEIMCGMFEFWEDHREAMRLALASLFAPPNEYPKDENCAAKGRRNFELLMNLMKEGKKSGILKRHFNTEQLALGYIGLMNMYGMLQFIEPNAVKMNRKTAKDLVTLFLEGALNKQSSSNKTKK
ncbi:MAG: TetR/AcrR family transcriptional regulator [Verrucomicrobia bacterium]|nr:TetR/AcrR family transcriptional regulator [Verrucomicrobiota bacterium]MCF7708495.1 TetR/AcrR family transcriptional regulator [Verrucomicrobiota bacterium]